MTRQFFVRCALVAISLSANNTWLRASTPSLGTPQATPSSIAINTPTTVTVIIAISDPAVIPASVSVVRLATNGALPNVLTKMQPNGNGIYSAQITLNEPAAGQIQLQVSAAVRGAVKRTFSTPVAINVF